MYAVQVLFRIISEKKLSVDELIKESRVNSEVFISENLSLFDIDQDFFCKLIMVTKENCLKIDEIISNNLSDNWKVNRLDPVIICILQLGIAELLYLTDIPPKVVLNEYIEISKAFFQKNEVAFVNGLLNSVANAKNL
jgi:transcription antitermination factor NusB